MGVTGVAADPAHFKPLSREGGLLCPQIMSPPFSTLGRGEGSLRGEPRTPPCPDLLPPLPAASRHCFLRGIFPLLPLLSSLQQEYNVRLLSTHSLHAASE